LKFKDFSNNRFLLFPAYFQEISTLFPRYFLAGESKRAELGTGSAVSENILINLRLHPLKTGHQETQFSHPLLNPPPSRGRRISKTSLSPSRF
jgi:hypothetical protein